MINGSAIDCRFETDELQKKFRTRGYYVRQLEEGKSS